MVGALSSAFPFREENSLSLFRYRFIPTHPSPFFTEPDAVLIPEIVEEREIPAEENQPAYNRFGRVEASRRKGLFVDSYS